MKSKSRNKGFTYKSLRAELIHRGFTLRSFALANGYSVPTVYMAARGDRSGIISTKIRNHLEQIIHE